MGPNDGSDPVAIGGARRATEHDHAASPPETAAYQHALEQLTLIAQITNPVVGARPLHAQVQTLLEQVRSAYGVDACVVRTLEDEHLTLLAATGVPAAQLQPRLPANMGISRQLIEERRPLTIENVETESATALLAWRARYDPAKFCFLSYAGAPLLVEDRVVGILGIYSTQHLRRFSASELNHLQIVANHIAISIVNERLYEELREKREQLHLQMQEREQAEQLRRSIEEQLRHAQRMEALGHLAGGVAHDFNNILTVILGGTELLRDAAVPDLPAQWSEWVARVDDAARRASNLTRQLLAFSRKQPNNPTVFDLHQAVRDLQKMLRRLVREDIELSLHCDGEPCLIRADRGQIEQVIVNLVVNARDAIAGGGHIEVACTRAVPEATDAASRAEQRGKLHALLTVRDDGMGMDAETARRAFEPFFTTKAPGVGTGLGLSTVYGIVQQAGGQIGVESTPGQGATFHVYLPLAEDAATAPSRPDSQPTAMRGTEVVLVCEDEAQVRRVICAALSSAGYTVLEAPNGPAALELVRKSAEAVDLLVTDMVMPGMNGRELAARLHETFPQLRCLLVSGYLGHMAGDGSDARPWEHVLPKPFGPRTLLERVQAVLGKMPARDPG